MVQNEKRCFFEKEIINGKLFDNIWVFLTPETATADVKQETSHLQQSGLTRTLPLMIEEGDNDPRLAFTYKIKVTVESTERESIVIHRLGQYQNNPNREDSLFFYSNDITMDYSLVNDAIPGTRSGKETFTIINYSSTPLKVKTGITSGIHVKGHDLFFDGIDFCLN